MHDRPHDLFSHRRSTGLRLPTLAALALLLVGLVTVGCGGGDATAESADDAGSSAAASSGSAAAASAGDGVQAAKAIGTIETKYFETVLPEGWEILADDIDSMGLMTVAEQGTGGSHGVYMKFEAGYSGDPMANVEKVASSYDGSAPATSTRNGIEWASTRYTYSGITQTMNITAHNGTKVTFTVMGDDYSSDPGVRAIFEGLTLK